MTTMHAIFADRVFTPDQEITDALVLIENGRITAAGSRTQLALPTSTAGREVRQHNAAGLTIVPGFIDLHIHGAGGHDVMEGTAAALATIAETVARRGTTSLVATTMTATPERTCRAATGIAAWMRDDSRVPRLAAGPEPNGCAPRAEILGIHFEGPFISPLRRGVHPLEWIAAPSVPLLDQFLEAAQGTGRILTLAPELPAALDLQAAARAHGLVVSVGHTEATYAQAMAAIDRGATQATHVFNAMRPFAHRETGVLGAVLTAPSVACELIADGLHVDGAAMRLLLAAKTSRNIVLVSDGTAATGMPDGDYALGTLSVTVSNGVPRDGQGTLAGSTLTLDRALRTIVALGVPLPQAVAMLTSNPARVLGLAGKKGEIVAGADADLVMLDADLNVAGVITRGSGWIQQDRITD